MKNIKYFSGLFVALSSLLISSCSEDLVTGDSTGFVKSVVITGEDIEYEDGMFTRATYTEKLQYSWSMGDTIGIYPLGGDQIAFPISSGDGSKSAEFDGGAWRMRSSFWYAAYYPYSTLNCLVKETSLPVCYLDQIQDGNDSRNGLSKYDYQVSAATKPTSSGGVNIQMKHLGGFMRFALTIPEATELKALVVKSGSTPFVTKGVVDLSQEVPAITPTETSDKLVMLLKNITTSSANESVVLWMTASPMVFAANSMLTVTIYGSDGVRYSAQVLAKDMTPGSGKGYSATLEKVTTGASSEDIDVDFDDEEEVDDTPYLTFHAEDAQTLKMSKEVPTLEYSVNGGDWATLGTTQVAFGGATGDLRLRGKSSYGTGTTFVSNYSRIIFTSNTPVSASGDIRTLVNWESYENADCSNTKFCNLFYLCNVLTTAPELPSTTLAEECYAGMFSGCSSLTTAPALPATTLAEDCYGGMFFGCTALETAPALPATTLANSCYSHMFEGCSSLTTAPALPATTLAEDCYRGMFYGCYTLTTAPALPATTLADHCYSTMFYGCYTLTTAPDLPATTLADNCYEAMFKQCTSLETAPALLPATTLAYSCYADMFNDTSLTTAPDLPATTLANSCYIRMFEGCYKLNYVKMMATDVTASNCLYSWLNCVSSSGTFYKSIDATWDDDIVVPEGWTVKYLDAQGNEVIPVDDTPYVTFKSATVQTFKLSQSVSGMQYSVDKSSWADLGSDIVTFGSNYGDLRLRSINANGTASSSSNYASVIFGNYDPVYCSGDIRTLVDYKNYKTANTSNARFCYLFNNCRGLKTAPELPSETLAVECYTAMFRACHTLEKMPDLPARTISENCYSYMFESCLALTEVVEELPATTLTEGCYNQMFFNCQSLDHTPILPALTLLSFSYYRMFYSCANLKKATIMATSIDNGYRCIEGCLDYVADNGIFYKNPNATWSNTNIVPTNWTVVNAEY